MNYAETLKYLYGLQKFGMKLGLENIRSLLASVGNPEREFPSIHIAGTNGKGSSAAMITSILQEAGFKVGLYTSPHLVDFTERIRINGEPIDPRNVAVYMKKLKPQIGQLRCTFFEATTALAFLYFAREKVDLAIIETGLGGRLDATNVINPLLSIITNIGLDHTEHLGHTLADIAREKAGIIKKGIPCLIGSMALKAEEVMEAKAESSSAKLILARSASRCRFGSQSFEGITIHLDTQKSSYNKLRIRLPGGFQAENARLAVLAVEELRDTNPRFTSITPVSIRAGLRNIRRNTGLRGRFEVIQKEPAIIIDVAHNPDGIDRLVTALRTVLLQKVLVVFGVMKDKDCERMLRRLKEVAKEVITVSPAVDRALSSRSLFNLAVRMGTRAVDGVSVKEGIAVALGKAEKFDRILITGSHYVVGEAIQVLEGKSRLVSRQTLHKPTVR